jgi:hypothetical protein
MLRDNRTITWRKHRGMIDLLAADLRNTSTVFWTFNRLEDGS